MNTNSNKPISMGYMGPTPPVSPFPQRGSRHWIERPEQLLRATQALASADFIAIDTEFVTPRPTPNNPSSIPRLALLQLAIDNHCFVIDAWRLHDLTPLNQVLNDPNKNILLHGAGADLKVMGERDLSIAHFYDLEATCRSLFGQHESSLAAMLHRSFNIHLDKSLQRTDWTRRPITPAMVAYAARDAECTLALYDWLYLHFSSFLSLHEYPGQDGQIAFWLTPYLKGNSSFSISDARSQGLLRNNKEIAEDCREALQLLVHPARKGRLLRVIADLTLVELIPVIIPLLQERASDVRASAIRTLGRLGAFRAKQTISFLYEHDPVHDVRLAAEIALRHLEQKRQSPPPPARIADTEGRNWKKNAGLEETEQEPEAEWKARLRSMMDA